MSKKIAFFELEDWQIEYLRKKLVGFDAQFYKEPLSNKNVIEVKDIEYLGVFIYSKVDSGVLHSLPNLKCIFTLSTGFDHIDLKACSDRNITVCNVPFYGENTVAEHTFALILTLSRQIYSSISRTKQGKFDYAGLRGFDLKGKTLGLIGTGSIGVHAAAMANGFGMKLLGYDIILNKELETKYGLKYVDLETLLTSSDIISLHLPLNNKTKHIINRNNIKLLRANAIIVNTSRGGLIETTALVEALQSKTIAGAALDVLEEENYIKDKINMSENCHHDILQGNLTLLKMDNVIVTPHNAFNSQEALQRILDTTIENVNNCVSGKLTNVVKF